MKSIIVGVGIITLNSDNSVLFGKRKLGNNDYCWSLPGGKVEFTEKIDSCAKRELFEETNLIADNIKIISVSNIVVKNHNYHSITYGALVTSFKQELKNKEKQNFFGWEWFNIQNLPENIFIPSKYVLKAYYNEFSVMNNTFNFDQIDTSQILIKDIINEKTLRF